MAGGAAYNNENEQGTESAWSRWIRTRNPPGGLGFRRFQGAPGADICLEEADPDPAYRRSSDFSLQPFLHQIPRASARGVMIVDPYEFERHSR